MSKHTPAPWQWMWIGTAGGWKLVHLSKTGTLGVQEAEYVNMGGPPDQPPTPDQILIAQSPRLLEALKALANHVDKLDRRTGTLSPLMEQVREAVAAAEGTE